MSNQKFLPKKAYSISDAVKYISLNYNINISECDLLEYIQSGELQSSIYLNGRINKIYSVNRRDIPDSQKIEVREDEIFLQFNKSEVNAKINHIKEFELFRIDINNIYFDLGIVLNDMFYLDGYFDNNSITLYDDKMGKFQNIIFTGYFPLHKGVFERYNISELMNQGFIDEFPDIRMNMDDFYLHIPVCENKTKLYLDDICILHKDIIEFLEFFSVIDSNSHQDELHKLKNEVDSKNKLIEELQKQIEKNNKVKISTASENKKNAFIKSLLLIHYNREVAENPRPHVYDPNDSNKSKYGVIQKDFDCKGLTKHLPSGKTLKNWVDAVELEN